MDKALERDPDNPGYLTFQGSLELKSGDETTAEKSYKRALALVPDNAEAALGLGELLLKQNRDKEALDTLDSLEAKALTNELLLRRAQAAGPVRAAQKSHCGLSVPARAHAGKY